MDVVDARSDVVGVAKRLEDAQELEVGLGGFDRDDIGVESDDVVEDVVEVCVLRRVERQGEECELALERLHNSSGDVALTGVAEVRVDLSVILNTGGRELERVDSPGQVAVPVGPSEGKTLSDGGLVDLDGEDLCLFEVLNLVAECEGELLRLDLSLNVDTWEGPVQDRDWTGQHSLDGLARQSLSVRGPLNGHRLGSRDVRDDDGWSDISGAVRLDPGVLGEDEALELLAEVLLG